MRKHITNRTRKGIVVLVLVLAAITLGVRFYLHQALMRHESIIKTESAPSESKEQLIVTETPGMENEASEGTLDQIQQFEQVFAEIRTLEELAAREQQGSALKEDYTTIAKLWNKQLDELGRAITENMTESEKETYTVAANAFLISRNHECMKELGRDKLSVMENIDYLRREIALTRERCLDLLKDYRKYLEK